ncbi:MAG: ChaN family lipoprotein [Oligoflexia bacterium]|nr:ChaN family lipoprotein [Oligoflexia bacterium]
MTAREQLLKMQRIILRQIKNEVFRLEGPSRKGLASYYSRYQRELRGFARVSSKRELLSEVRKAQIVFGADFHAFSQSQRTHLRILRSLSQVNRPVILCLEAFGSRFQKEIERYLQGKVSDAEFLKRSQYFENWGFPWENYQVLFEYARANKVKVFGINDVNARRPEKELRRRDLHSATVISKIHRENPTALIYVIYGDLHLAKGHLPKLTRKLIGSRTQARFVTIFQNSENLYWRLAKRKLEDHVDVVRLRSDAFCVVNSPPWLKWQAYLSFLEGSAVQERRERGDAGAEFIHEMIKVISQVWGVTPLCQHDYNIYSYFDFRLFKGISEVSKRKNKSALLKLVEGERNFFIPHPRTFFLLNYTVNHGASLAGQYLHAKMRRERELHYDFPGDLVPLIWIEAIGFFASRVLNSRRKPNSHSDLPVKSQSTLIVLEQQLKERLALKGDQVLKALRPQAGRRFGHYYLAGRYMGSQLGAQIYNAFRAGSLRPSELHRWLRKPVANKASFYVFYTEVLRFLKGLENPEPKLEERL